MQIVIDIPKYVYDTIVASKGYIADCDNEKVGMAVKNGTPLPKGHGDLIDTNDLECFCQTHEVGTSAFYGELIYCTGSTSRGDTLWKPLLGALKPIIKAESE